MATHLSPHPEEVTHVTVSKEEAFPESTGSSFETPLSRLLRMR
jgi:hypothetical protein